MQSTEIQKLAETTAAVLGNNQDFTIQIEEYLGAREDVARGPVVLMFKIATILGKEKMAGLPRPGSEYKPGSNEPYDKYEIVSNGGKTEKGSFCNDLFNDLPIGARIKQAMANIKLAQAGSQGAPAPYATMGAPELDREYRRLDQNKRNGRDALRRAIALWHKLNDVQAMPGIVCRFSCLPDGSPDNSTTPIFVQDASKNENFRNFSAQAFLNLDIQHAHKTAAEKGGLWAALVSSGGTGGTRNDKATTPETKVWTVDTVNSEVADLAAFFEKKDAQNILLKLVNEKDADAFVESFGDVHFAMAAFFEAHVARKYRALQARKSEAHEKSQAA